MRFKNKYPEFARIEQHIRRANAERSVHIAALLADAVFAIVTGLRRLFPASAPAAGARSAKPLIVKARLAETARY